MGTLTKGPIRYCQRSVLICILLTLINGALFSQDAEASYRYLALGDSYTIGESVDIQDRWPVQLQTRLKSQGIVMQSPVIIAKTGWTTDELAEGIAVSPSIDPPYDLVTLLIGVNNQYRGRDVEEFAEQFSSLLDDAIHYAGGASSKVVVLSIPDWGVMPFARDRDRQNIATEIDAFNAKKKALTLAAGALFCDITMISREAESDLSLVASDNLHPSKQMYAQWVDKVYPLALNILSDR